VATTFPRLIDDVTPHWLAGVLGRPVTGIRVEPIGVGIGILGVLYRVHLEPTGSPASVVVKMSSPVAENRAFGAGYTLYEKEVRFYQQAAHRVPLRTPHCWYAEIDEAHEWCCIVMEDITNGASPDQIAGLTFDEAAAGVDALAGLHGTFWEHPDLQQMTWLPTLDAPQFLAAEQNCVALFPMFEERYGPALGAAHVELSRSLLPHIAELLSWWAARGPYTLTHSDMRGDNLLFVGSPSMSNLVVLDWQMAVRSRGAYDLAYFLIGSLQVDDRRRWQDALIDRYVAGLARHGVSGYDSARCLQDMREWTLVLVSTSPALSAADTGNERGRQFVTQMLSRWAAAAADYDVAALRPWQ
jgi:hypothetical protein